MVTIMCVFSVLTHSVRSDSSRLLCPWDFSGKNTGLNAISLFRGSSRLSNWTSVSCVSWREAWSHGGKPHMVTISSVQFSLSVVSDSLWPHESQHTRPPVHHQLPEFTQTHVHRVSDAIQPFHPLSSPSPPAPNPSQHQSLFQWVNSSHEVAKVLEFQL